MIFVTAIFFALLFAGIFVALEIRGRQARGLKPGTVGELWVYAQKRTATDLRYPALIFSLSMLFVFQLWEAFLRFLLQRDSHVAILLAGVAAVVTAIVLRQRRLSVPDQTDRRLGVFTLLLLMLGFSVMLNSWGTIFFLPWVYFRARFLPKRLG